tara:strand:- start:443 stop:679 length:237 start_codon:yes stop_codon:yes gene_type:complete
MIRLAFVTLASLIFLVPSLVLSEEIDSQLIDNNDELISHPQQPRQMSKDEIDDLFGPDPYLGPTSWLGAQQDKINIEK